MSSKLEYECRLVPIDKWTDVLAARQGAVCERFDKYSFAGEQAHPERVDVNLSHAEQRRIGRLSRLQPKDGWWVARFRLEGADAVTGYAQAVLQIGSPVSVEFSPIHQRMYGPDAYYQLARLDGISIVDRAAYADACIVAIRDLAAPVSTEPFTIAPELAASLARHGIHGTPALARKKPEPRLEPDVITHPPGTILTRNCGRILGVR
jgi:hypothetical protein